MKNYDESETAAMRALWDYLPESIKSALTACAEDADAHAVENVLTNGASSGWGEMRVFTAACEVIRTNGARHHFTADETDESSYTVAQQLLQRSLENIDN